MEVSLQKLLLHKLWTAVKTSNVYQPRGDVSVHVWRAPHWFTLLVSSHRTGQQCTVSRADGGAGRARICDRNETVKLGINGKAILKKSSVHQSFQSSFPCWTQQLIPDQPLVFRLDLKDLHCSLLMSIQSFGFLAVPLGLVLLGPGKAQDHSLVTQHARQIMSRILPNAVLQERLSEGLRLWPGLRLEMRQVHLQSLVCKVWSNTKYV